MAFAYPMPDFEDMREGAPSGFGMLSVPNASTMVWKQFNAKTGAVIDEHVYQSHHHLGGFGAGQRPLVPRAPRARGSKGGLRLRRKH